MRVRALWVSGLKITAGEQTMAGLIGELIGQLLLFNIILQHSLWVENTVDFFFLLFGIIFLPRWNENITLQQCFICY